jgi:hypothetical protein
MSAIVSLVVSVIALALSSFSTFRQIRHTRSASEMKMVLELALHNIRDKDFQDDQRYVLTQLNKDYGAEQGIDALPEPVRSAARSVAFTYDYIGMISALRMVDPRVVQAIFHFRVKQAWQALKPYIQRERQLRRAPVCPFFEALVIQLETQPVDKVIQSLGVRYTSNTHSLASK